MIINNIESTIGVQNFIEVAAGNEQAAELLRQISVIADVDSTLSDSTRQAIQKSVSEATKHLQANNPSRELLSKSLEAIKGVGSIAGLVSKFLDLF